MVNELRALQHTLKESDRRISRLRSAQVHGSEIRDGLRSVVDEQFRHFKQGLKRAGISDSAMAECDGDMQALLEAAGRRSTVGVYRRLIKRINQRLMEFEKLALLANADDAAQSFDPVDQKVIDTLKRLLPSAALSYEQAVIDLQAETRLSWRGPATDLREALRETLDHLAPDADVKAQDDYKPEPNTSGPTMSQKTRFILKNRGMNKSEWKASDDAVNAIETMVGSFVRSVYTRSNVSTHTPTDKDEVIRVRNFVRLAMTELLSIR